MARGCEPGPPAAREVEREAKCLLPRLLKDAGRLRPLGDRPDGAAAGFGLFTRRNGYRRPVGAVPARLVEAFARRQWLEETDRGWRLGEAGAAWLRRQQGEPDPFRAQHQLRAQGSAEIAGVRRPVTVNDGESPLGWLRRRTGRDGKALVDEAQYKAGERLRADFWRAHMSPRVTANWASPAPARRMRRAAPAAEMHDQALAARQRVRAALEAVGPELSGILIDVCCHLQGLAEAEQAQGWPRRSGKVVLGLALTRLARHYGLIGADEAAGPTHRRLRHWGARDYRPSLDDWR